MAKTRTELQQLGPADIELDDVDFGFALKANAKITYEVTDLVTGHYGKTPLDQVENAIGIEVDVEFTQFNFANMAKLLQQAQNNVSGSDENISAGQVGGTKSTVYKLNIKPANTLITSTHQLQVHRVVVSGSPELPFDGVQGTVKVTFRGLIDIEKEDGDRLFRFGNVTVSADITAPTLSSHTPTDGQTLAAPATITATFSEAMDTSSARNGDTVVVVTNPTAASEQTRVAGVITWNAGRTVMTWTGTLAGATQYVVALTTGLKNAAGIAYAGTAWNFTTS